MLTASKIQVKRGLRSVLENFSLEISPGDGVGLVGPNGSGKTSLLLALLGVIPAAGTIEKRFTSLELGVIWQDRCLPLNVSVKNWLGYLSGIFDQPVDNELLERFQLQNNSVLIRTMSGGEAQKLAIVSAFFHKPKMLVLDEPTVGLDLDSRREFLNLCKERISSGASILITSHISSDISAIATRITNLSGTKSQSGSFFTTSRELSKREMMELARALNIKEIQLNTNGYFVSSSEDFFAILAKFANDHDFAITSFSSLS